MSAVESSRPVDLPQAGTVEPAPAPVLASDNVVAPIDAPASEELSKTEGEAVAPVSEVNEAKAEKIVEPIYSGALGYKAPGLKNAFRFAKKYFWFGEEPVPSSNLREYLRGEKPEVAHSVVAWSSQTGKGLLFFVKHADQKEHPAGALNLAYATDLVKDGTLAFSMKISGHKHTFEAQSAPERDGWFVAVERAITEAKAAKDGIESSEGYKEHKEKIGKPTTLVGATAYNSTPKKSLDATPKLAEAEAAGAEVPVVVAPARAGSSSSSSSNEEKRAKKASKSKSRSVSRKRGSIFGGLLGKKDKDLKDVSEATPAETEIKDEAATAPQLGETSTTAPVITQDIPNVGDELKTETAAAAGAPATTDEVEAAKAPVATTQDKPKPTKRGSIFGFVEKLKSPTHEKKEYDLIAPQTPAKDETALGASKPLEEAQVGAPLAPTIAEPVLEPVASKGEETKHAAVHTPSKEKEHFSFGKLFGSKERATEKVAEPKVDAAPKIEETPTAATDATEPVQPLQTIEPVDPVVPATEEKEISKKEKRTSFFGNLTRSLSKAGKKDVVKTEKKETVAIPEANEDTIVDAPVVAAQHEDSPALAAPIDKSIGDVPAEAVTIGEAPKSSQAVSSTA